MDEILSAEEMIKQSKSTELTAQVEAQTSTPTTPTAPTETEFSKRMEVVKQDILAQASVEDTEFVKKVTETVKSAAIKNVEVEENKAELEKQKVEFQSEILETSQAKNKHIAKENKWENKEKRRLYAYNGVKPIMTFVGINEPLNLTLLYFLTTFLLPFFLFAKLWKGTIGALVSGASDQDRPKAVKGFLWTLIGVIAVIAILMVVYLFLKWQGLIY